MRTHLFARIGTLIALAVALPAASNAASLLLDFGPTTTAAADALQSPGHAVGAVPGAQITWNKITADTSALVYADGSAAAGIAIDLGRSQAGTKVIDFTDNGFNASGLTGTALTTGIYANTSPARDGVFGGSGGANNLAMGLRVDGLAPGAYVLYFTGRNSNVTSPAVPQRFYVATGPGSTSFPFSLDNTNIVVQNVSPPTTSGFVLNDNYSTFTVTIGTGESLFLACEGTISTELRGFMNTVEIVAGVPPLAAKVTGQPANKSVYEGVTVIFNVPVSGTAPLTNQWRYNGTNMTDGGNISGTTSNVLTLRNVTASMAGAYSLTVSNTYGHDVSSNATLTVTSLLNTDQMTNLWSLRPGDRPYLGTGATERGLVFNPLTTNLLIVSRLVADPAVAVLDGLTGADKYYLNVSGIPASTAGVSLGLNVIGVAEDGAVYGASVTVGATSPPFNIYRWPDDSSNNAPVLVFAGDPAGAVQPNLRWGDNIVVRGAGAQTQILLAPGTGTNVVLLRTQDGMDFQTEVPPAVISVSGVPSGFAKLGLAFGPGTNTFWAKTAGTNLYLVQFDADAGTGSILQSYPTTIVPAAVRGIGADASQKFLAGVMLDPLGDHVRLYDVSDLTVGPLLRDEEVFATQNASLQGTAGVSFGGHYLFALDENNGIKAFFINTNYVAPSVSIVGQPVGRTAMEGATVTFTAQAASTQPLSYQWRFNGTNNLADGANISGAHTTVLTLGNITTNSAGNYSLFASNAFGSATSSNALLTVIPTFNTPQMSNIWNLLAGDRAYLGTNGTERGMAFDPATTNLLLASRAGPDPMVVVLDAATGAEKRFLDVTGIPGTTPGVSLGLNTIGVADDGVVFGASVTVSATSPAFYLYRWPDDSANNAPTLVFAGDPAAAVEPNLRWTDTLAVRGSGPDTQVLISPGTSTNVVLLRSNSGLDFQTEIPPAVIGVANVPSGFAQLGLAFGPGTNTFWAKTVNSSLYLVQFDLNSQTGVVLHEYTTNTVPPSLRSISTGLNQHFLAGLALELSDNVRLYDISDLNAGPVLRDQEVFTTQNPNTTVTGTGATAFGGNYLFALDSNNGIKAFVINTNYSPLQPFKITSINSAAGSVVLGWQSISGHVYQAQSRDALTTGGWTNLGSAITATDAITSFTNAASGNSRFYRIQAQ